jgi:hypothetical protein
MPLLAVMDELNEVDEFTKYTHPVCTRSKIRLNMQARGSPSFEANHNARETLRCCWLEHSSPRGLSRIQTRVYTSSWQASGHCP